MIDSIVGEAGATQLYPMAFQLKNDLYAVLRQDPNQVSELFGRYDYPNVGPTQRDAFIRELIEIVEHRQELVSEFGGQMLKGVLQMALRLEALPFLEDETPNVLLEGFSAFYINRIGLFKNSRHILDVEETIMAKLKDVTFISKGIELQNHIFVDSKVEFGIQIADAVVGLLGRAFTYINRTSISRIKQDMSQLSAQQRGNIDLLASIIDRSIAETAAFAHYVISIEDQERGALLFDR